MLSGERLTDWQCFQSLSSGCVPSAIITVIITVIIRLEVLELARILQAFGLRIVRGAAEAAAEKFWSPPLVSCAHLSSSRARVTLRSVSHLPAQFRRLIHSLLYSSSGNQIIAGQTCSGSLWLPSREAKAPPRSVVILLSRRMPISQTSPTLPL